MDKAVPKNKLLENTIKKKGSYKNEDSLKSKKILESSSKSDID